jgi:hypothetical protein
MSKRKDYYPRFKIVNPHMSPPETKEEKTSEVNQPAKDGLFEQIASVIPGLYLERIKVSMNSTTGEVDTHYFPYYIKKELAGYKVRRLPKQFLP